MAWINNNTGKMYYAGSITINRNGVLFSGIPTSEQLTEWGFVEYIPPTVDVADLEQPDLEEEHNIEEEQQ